MQQPRGVHDRSCRALTNTGWARANLGSWADGTPFSAAGRGSNRKYRHAPASRGTLKGNDEHGRLPGQLSGRFSGLSRRAYRPAVLRRVRERQIDQTAIARFNGLTAGAPHSRSGTLRSPLKRAPNTPRADSDCCPQTSPRRAGLIARLRRENPVNGVPNAVTVMHPNPQGA